MDAIALKALAKSPADRYQDAREFREDILRALNGQPVMAAFSSPTEMPTTVMPSSARRAAPTTAMPAAADSPADTSVNGAVDTPGGWRTSRRSARGSWSRSRSWPDCW